MQVAWRNMAITSILALMKLSGYVYFWQIPN